MEYNYNKFLSDSSDDHPKYHKQEVDDWWYRDMYDHAEEKARDEIGFEEDDIELVERDFLLAFREVIRLARCAVQPWWTDEYKAKSETKINLIQEHFNNLKNKS